MKIKTIKAFIKDLKEHDIFNKSFNASLWKTLWNVFISNKWDLIELHQQIVEKNSTNTIRAAMFLVEKNKKEESVLIRHFNIFSQNEKYLKRTLPKYFTNLLLDYKREGYHTLMFCFYNASNAYVRYLLKWVKNIKHSAIHDRIWNLKHKKNYYILYLTLLENGK